MADGSGRRRVGPFSVNPLGLGCMSLSHGYGRPPSAAEGEALLRHAFDLGVDFFDTAALYGFGSNESLVGRVLKDHRSRITLCSKGGMAGVQFADGMKRVIDGRPETIRRNCEDSLRRLGTDVIDLYYLHRWDQRVPIEDSVGEMSRLLAAGKVRACGAPDQRGADRVFAVDAQPRDRGTGHLPRDRRRLRRLQPAGARLPDQHAA